MVCVGDKASPQKPERKNEVAIYHGSHLRTDQHSDLITIIMHFNHSFETKLNGTSNKKADQPQNQ